MFNRNRRLDTSQIDDQRGRRMRPGQAGVALGGGGGLIAVIVAVVIALAGGGGGGSGSALSLDDLLNQSLGAGAGPEVPSTLAEDCQTGQDANERDDCRIVGVVNSVQAFWDDEFTRRGGDYTFARTQFFSGQTTTGCGAASSAVGPFYCPPDQQVFIDLGFFEELRERFGAQGGPFAQAYVIAHEYGHHVQNLTGVLGRTGRDSGPQSNAVRAELQADCYAGLWAHHAVDTGFIERLTEANIADALDAAAAVGDDRIQETVTGRVTPESWTHGSATQRQRWFLVGYQSGDLEACDTFAQPI